MDNIEEKFYKTFGLEPFCDLPCNKRGIECTDNTYCGNKYPDITAEKLLQLLCIVIDEYNRNGHIFYLDSTNVKELKEEILGALMGCIDASCDLCEVEVKQIQQLFKEEE